MTVTDSVSANPGETATPSQAKPFNPQDYLTSLSRRQRQPDGSWKNIELPYMLVQNRILWLRTEHPDAKIEVTAHAIDDHKAVMRCHITLPNGAEATDFGSETPEDWTDYVEKAATKSIGRACALLGFGVAFAGAEFFLEQEESKRGDQRIADAPLGPKQPPATPAQNRAASPRTSSAPPAARGAAAAPTTSQTTPNGSGGSGSGWDAPATEPQIKALHGIARQQHGWTDDQLVSWVGERFGASLSTLSKRKASEAIDALKNGAPDRPKSAASGQPTDVPPVTVKPMPAATNVKCSIAQVNQIHALMREANTDEAAFATWVKEAYGADDLLSLDGDAAVAIIEGLQSVLAPAGAS